MSDFAPAISKSVRETFSFTIHLKCNYHFHGLTELTNSKHFKNKVLKYDEIPAHFRPYFFTKAFLDKRKRNEYSPLRIFKYDLSILNKLPTEALFNAFFESVKPFWKEYFPDALKLFEGHYLESKEKSGWQYYLSGTLPKTNNNLEAYNRTIKDYVTQRRIQTFSDYFDLMKEEIIRKSESEVIQFPKEPRILNDFYFLATVMAGKFEELFYEYDHFYYIKDPFINSSFLKKDKKSLTTKVKKLIQKMKNVENAKNEFLEFFSLPSSQEVKRYEELGTMSKGAILNLCKIRKVSVQEKVGSDSVYEIKCSCNDFREVNYCLHSLCLAIKKGYISGKTFTKNKKRGPKPKIGGALEREDPEEI